MIVSKAENGLRYAVLREGKRVACCALSVRCGTREEDVRGWEKSAGKFHSGTAHFVEHTLFKGTETKSSTVINSYLERLGGELNAYTTKEEIVLHATVLKEDIEKAAGLLMEMATRATFPEDEIEVEKTVVTDEIAGYKDSPADDIYDRFESLLFEGHPLSGRVLGTPSSVRKISTDELRKYVRTFFVPERIAFSVVAPLPEDETAAMIERLVSEYFPAECGVTAAGESVKPDSSAGSDIVPPASNNAMLQTAEFAGNVFDKSDPYAFYSEMRPNSASVIVNLKGFQWKDQIALPRERAHNSGSDGQHPRRSGHQFHTEFSPSGKERLGLQRRMQLQPVRRHRHHGRLLRLRPGQARRLRQGDRRRIPQTLRDAPPGRETERGQETIRGTTRHLL